MRCAMIGMLVFGMALASGTADAGTAQAMKKFDASVQGKGTIKFEVSSSCTFRDKTMHYLEGGVKKSVKTGGDAEECFFNHMDRDDYNRSYCGKHVATVGGK